MAKLNDGDLTTALILLELETTASAPRSFFAERILINILHQEGGWYGTTASISRFCPHTLPIGSEVVGPIVNGHHIISVRLLDDKEVPIEPNMPEKGSGVFAVMLCPDSDPELLQSANIFCPNPICVNVCSCTFSQIDKDFREIVASERVPPGAQPKLHWTCNLCGTTMIVDRNSFDGLYKL